MPSLEFPSVGLFRETTESLDATIETLTKLREQSAGERKRLHDLLLGSTPSSETKAQQAMAQPHLTERQVRALNQAGESLARAESSAGVAAEPLGRLMDGAFTKNETPVFAGHRRLQYLGH